ncbi:VWA domain-containing protein [Granulosicoccaceae sp. 1_MG-2023]|nr:VWA domain-containing protein [Granulosicoccaceae sp. 1_MG-2023]
MVSFLWPFALLLLPLPWLRRRKPARADDEFTRQAIPIPPVLAEAFAASATTQRPWPGAKVWLLHAVWIALVLALAQPQWILGEPISRASGRSMMLVVDLSRSMEMRDFELDGRADNRLNVVKRVAGEFIRERTGDRLGLILFGDEAFVANPLSFDLHAADYALQRSTIGMAGRTTALGDALGLALIKLQADDARDKAVILLTDGSNNAGRADPAGAAQIAAKWGIRIHTIGLGSDTLPGSIQGQNASASLDTATLKTVALLSGGRYFRVQNSSELQAVYDTLDTLLAEPVAAPPFIPRRDIRHLPLLAALCCLGLYMLPHLRLRRRP